MNTVPYGLKLHRSVRNAPCSKYNQLRKWRQLTFSPSDQPHLQELHASSYMHAANFSHSLRNIALGHHTLLVFVHTSHSTSFFLPLPSFAASFPLDREICSDWKGEKRCNIHSHDILWEYSPSMTTVLLARKVILHYKRCPGFSFDGWRVSLDHTGGDLNARNATANAPFLSPNKPDGAMRVPRSLSAVPIVPTPTRFKKILFKKTSFRNRLYILDI